MFKMEIIKKVMNQAMGRLTLRDLLYVTVKGKSTGWKRTKIAV